MLMNHYFRLYDSYILNKCIDMTLLGEVKKLWITLPKHENDADTITDALVNKIKLAKANLP
jgi:hypothetical protein